MKVGFTGTRHGMTEQQRAAFTMLVNELNPNEFHHGDCVGADDDAAKIAAYLDACYVVCHPPLDESHRAFNNNYHEIREPKTHFARNRDIVDETERLIATPFDMTRQTRGGTWYTIDYALKKKKWVYVIWPNGMTEAGADAAEVVNLD